MDRFATAPILVAVAAAAVAWTAALPAAAQDWSDRMAFEASFSQGVPKGMFADRGRTRAGLGGGFNLTVELTRHVSVYGGLHLQRFRHDLRYHPLVVSTASDAGGALGVRLSPLPSSRLEPWIRGGATYSRHEIAGCCITGPLTAGLEGGGGLLYRVSRQFSAGPSAVFREYTWENRRYSPRRTRVSYVRFELTTRYRF